MRSRRERSSNSSSHDQEVSTHALLLNNDATVAPDYFAELATALDEAPDAGLLSGTIVEAAPPHRVWYAGGIARPLRALMLHARALPADDRPRDTEFVCGCSMVIGRPVVDALGLLPDCYFPGYCEDAEYSTRARRRGFRLVYAPRPRVFHKVGASFGLPGVTPSTAFWQNRHRVFYVRRNLRGVQRWTAFAYLLVTKPGRALVEAARGRPGVGWAIFRGMVAGFVARLP